jgi:hypothetical protein
MKKRERKKILWMFVKTMWNYLQWCCWIPNQNQMEIWK